MRAPLGEVKRVLKILVFFVFLPLFLAPSCKPKNSNSNAAPVLDLSAPTGFGATTISKTQIDLAWTNVALDVLNYEIERSVNGGAFAPLTTLPAAATGYSDTGLTASTQYSYRIRSVNAGSTGPWTVISATTILVQSVTTTPDPVDGAPTARMGASMIYDPGGNRLLILGGLTSPGVVTNELWALNLGTNQWSKPTTTAATPGLRPSPRMGHTAILDPAPNNRMVVFGGVDPTTNEYDNIFFLDLGTMDWTSPPISQSPFARAGHTAIYDAANTRMIVYGGVDSVGPFDDVWEFTLPTGSGTADWNELTPSMTGTGGLRSGHSAVYDQIGGRMIVFGGQDNPPSGPPLNDLREFSLTTLTWSTITATGTPPGRFGHSAVLNGSAMLIFGGATPTASQEFWKLDLGGTPGWSTVLGSTLPAARLGHSVIFPTGTTTMMIFGGGTAPNTPSFLDVWAFGM